MGSIIYIKKSVLLGVSADQLRPMHIPSPPTSIKEDAKHCSKLIRLCLVMASSTMAILN